MSNPNWNATFRNFASRAKAKKLGYLSRSAQRHDVDEEKARQMYDRGLSDINIAAALGVSKGDVYRWRKLNGLISNMTRIPGASSRSKKTEET